VTFDRPAPFGRYRVNLDAIDTVGVPALLDALDQSQVVVVDEIGPMEILSPRFRPVATLSRCDPQDTG
jgi:nucleoside-triphosphatase